MRKAVILLVTIAAFVEFANAQAIAFPGAEGFGKYTTGGRGGKVYVVTNLNDNGPGSLREAVEAKHPRIVVFAISGTIHLESPLRLNQDLTIAGQTAPGDGICIADYPVGLAGDNIIVRYMRFRLGDRHQNKGKVPGSGHDDTFGGVRRKNIIIDHCSLSWSTDEVMSVYDGDSTTLQWNLISEPLNYSYHFEPGDTDFENHGYGGIWGGRNLTAHHNLFAHCVSRNPRFNGRRTGLDVERVDYVNNVLYNWGSNTVYGAEGGLYNIVNNYYKYGPNTGKNVMSRIVNPSFDKKKPQLGFGSFYVAGNYVFRDKDVTRNNVLGVHFDKQATEEQKESSLQKKVIGELSMAVESAETAYECVLHCVGASFPRRDSVDERIISEVKKGKGKIIDVQGGYPHGTDYEISKSAWPELKPAPAPKDSDMDGMPDDWETKNGLNPNDPADASQFKLSREYTNIEVYINSLLEQK